MQIVIGGGIVGLSAAFELEQRGHSVLLIEDGDAQGSAGSTRIFRTVHQDPALEDAARQSLEIWKKWGSFIEPRELWARTDWKYPKTQKTHPLEDQKHSYAVDTEAGIGHIAKTIDFLQSVIQGERMRATVSSVHKNKVHLLSGETLQADHVVVAAGIYSRDILGLPPRPLLEHVRFSFRMRENIAPPLLIDKRLGIYGVPDGQAFAIGMPTHDRPRSKNHSQFIKDCQKQTEILVEKHFPLLEPKAQEMIYYVYPGQQRDGPDIIRSPHWTMLAGQNLFKFAPWLGRLAASG